jgi:hypothetical protein
VKFSSEFIVDRNEVRPYGETKEGVGEVGIPREYRAVEIGSEDAPSASPIGAVSVAGSEHHRTEWRGVIAASRPSSVVLKSREGEGVIVGNGPSGHVDEDLTDRSGVPPLCLDVEEPETNVDRAVRSGENLSEYLVSRADREDDSTLFDGARELAGAESVG